MIIYNFIKNLYLNIKYSKLLNKIYKDERLLENLSELFGARFKKDLLGRIYAVINPNIKHGKYDTNQVYEYNEIGFDNSYYIEKWIMGKLNIASKFIQANNLFDLLTYKIKKLDDHENYLFIIEPITLQDCMKWSKRFLWLFVFILISTILYIIFI